MKIYVVQEVKAKHNSYDSDTLLSKKAVKAFKNKKEAEEFSLRLNRYEDRCYTLPLSSYIEIFGVVTEVELE